MNFINYIKIFKKTKFKKTNTREYTLVLNENPLDKLIIKSHLLHSETISILRKFTTPQYEKGWLLRNKKGFNTLMFKKKYDVIVCDRFGNVLETFSELKPDFVSHYYPNGHFVYFLNVGSIKYFDIKKSDRITLKRDLSIAKIYSDALGLG